jgi:hypothetical protein
MGNPEKSARPGTQDTGRRKQNKKHKTENQQI